ncbi:Ger(x)C family spore germination protein [Clostridium folliculivorans]|uniref:Germination protein n=1 Tax=Clostridium folliculivorans TaxID=2886038 RepID=A0A9W5Y4K9_9CLOT|nr:Ger(x)C family spore germination protein [Clostridium folliculivorans]GKU26561.1 germination protein [Clostridium folliculivorans]GKU29007.1 germination protein [Clostridium folliculivorans]
MKINLLSIILILTMLLTGCWDNNDINDLIIVSSMALDKGEYDNLKVTLLCIRPTSQISSGDIKTPQNNDVIIFSSEGDDIMDACNKISKKISRKLFFSQMENVLMGEYLARENASEYLDFFPRHPEPSIKTYMFLVKGSASKIFDTDSSLERNISQEIDKLKSLNVKAEVQIKDFLIALTEDGIDPIIPLLEVTKSDKKDNPSTASVASITGAGIFNKSKLVDFIDYDTYRGVLYIQNKIKLGSGTVTFPKESGGGDVTAKVLNSITKITPIIEKDQLSIKIFIKTKAHISENTTKLDLTKPSVIDEIDTLFENRIKNLAESAIDKAKNANSSDVFGFGSIVRGKYPKQWEDQYKKDWKTLLPSLKVSVVCDVDVTEIGFDAKSLQLKEEDILR